MFEAIFKFYAKLLTRIPILPIPNIDLEYLEENVNFGKCAYFICI